MDGQLLVLIPGLEGRPILTILYALITTIKRRKIKLKKSRKRTQTKQDNIKTHAEQKVNEQSHYGVRNPNILPYNTL